MEALSNKWNFIAIAITVAAIAVLTSVYLRDDGKKPDTEPPRLSKQETFDRILLSDVTLTAVDNDDVRLVLNAKQIIQKKKKIGFLTINPIKEMELKGVAIQVYEHAFPDDKHDKSFLLPLKETIHDVTSQSSSNSIAKLVINKLLIEFFKNSNKHFSIRSNTATLDLLNESTKFDNGTLLTAIHGQQVVSRQAEWRHQTNQFVVKGAYIFRNASGTQRGSNASFTVQESGNILLDKQNSEGGEPS